MSDETQTNESETEAPDPIRVAFDEAVEDSHSEDDVKLAMIQNGAKFSNVSRLYTQYMIDAGLAMSKEEKDSLVTDILEDADLSTEEGFTEARDAMVEEGTNVSDKQAASIIRAYARKNELEVWKAPKGTGERKAGFRDAFYAALVENPNMTKEQADEMIKNHDLSTANVIRHESFWHSIRKLANSIASK